MIIGNWLDASISASGTVSSEVDLGRAYETLLVVVPAVSASSQISVQVAEKSGGTFQDLYVTDPADGGDNQVISAAGTGAFTWQVPLGGFEFIKIKASVTATGDEAFRVCGVRS